MKKLSIALSFVALMLVGCGSTTEPAPQSTNTPVVSDATKNYEQYEGDIWDAEPFDCGGGIICLINNAEKCIPSKARFITEYRDLGQRSVKEHYEIGIQGTQFNQCQMYFKITDFIVNEKALKLKAMPLVDGSISHYQTCRFDKSTDIADLLRQGPKDAGSNKLGLGFLADNGMFSTMFDLNGTKNKASYVELAQQCYTHVLPDSLRKISSVQYTLAANESIEDASQTFRLRVDSIDKDKSATVTVIKDSKDNTETIANGEEKTILGYKIKVKSFTEKNVSKTDDSVMEPSVILIVGL